MPVQRKTAAKVDEWLLRDDSRLLTCLDFSATRFHQRHIALQIQYDGTAYYGFASQDLQDTVENHLFQALEKLNLISDRKVSTLPPTLPANAHNLRKYYHCVILTIAPSSTASP